MKTPEDLEKKVHAALQSNVSAALKSFSAERDQELKELGELNENLEAREREKEKLEKELADIRYHSNQRLHGELTMKIRHIEKDVKNLKERSERLFQRLTYIPDISLDDYPMMNFLLFITGKL